MVRTLACVAVLLAAGAAQSAPPVELVPVPATTLRESHFRFLSLAEARAIALEQGMGNDKSALAVLARDDPKAKGVLLVSSPPTGRSSSATSTRSF